MVSVNPLDLEDNGTITIRTARYEGIGWFRAWKRPTAERRMDIGSNITPGPDAKAIGQRPGFGGEKSLSFLKQRTRAKLLSRLFRLIGMDEVLME